MIIFVTSASSVNNKVSFDIEFAVIYEGEVHVFTVFLKLSSL